MKNLLYKEFKLAWHPLCYIFPIMFSCFILIPNYPTFIGLMMVGVTYTILFLGANKGKQTNDLLYTINLPVRRKDIVLARLFSMIIMQLMSIVITVGLAPVSQLIRQAIGIKNNMGFDLPYIGNTIGFALIGYIAVDACYLLMFYKKGRSIVAPSLIGMFTFLIFMSITTLALPMALPAYNAFFCDKFWVQFIVVGIALIVYVLSHILIVREAIKRLNKLDF